MSRTNSDAAAEAAMEAPARQRPAAACFALLCALSARRGRSEALQRRRAGRSCQNPPRRRGYVHANARVRIRRRTTRPGCCGARRACSRLHLSGLPWHTCVVVRCRRSRLRRARELVSYRQPRGARTQPRGVYAQRCGGPTARLHCRACGSSVVILGCEDSHVLLGWGVGMPE